MDKIVLTWYLQNGYSSYEVAKLSKKRRGSIRYWLQKYGLKLQFQSKWLDIPWKEIQAFYDNQGTYRGINKKYKLYHRCLHWAAQIGLLKLRSHKKAMVLSARLGRMQGGPWSLRQRNTARLAMLERLRLNPNCHPNKLLAHNRKKMSFPEKLAYDYLVSKNIKFEHNKFVAPYWPDFCIGRVIIEIDGKRWRSPKSDKRRDRYLSSLEYTVFRFSAESIIRDVTTLDSVISQLKLPKQAAI